MKTKKILSLLMSAILLSSSNIFYNELVHADPENFEFAETEKEPVAVVPIAKTSTGDGVSETLPVTSDGERQWGVSTLVTASVNSAGGIPESANISATVSLTASEIRGRLINFKKTLNQISSCFKTEHVFGGRIRGLKMTIEGLQRSSEILNDEFIEALNKFIAGSKEDILQNKELAGIQVERNIQEIRSDIENSVLKGDKVTLAKQYCKKLLEEIPEDVRNIDIDIVKKYIMNIANIYKLLDFVDDFKAKIDEASGKKECTSDVDESRNLVFQLMLRGRIDDALETGEYVTYNDEPDKVVDKSALVKVNMVRHLVPAEKSEDAVGENEGESGETKDAKGGKEGESSEMREAIICVSANLTQQAIRDELKETLGELFTTTKKEYSSYEIYLDNGFTDRDNFNAVPSLNSEQKRYVAKEITDLDKEKAINVHFISEKIAYKKDPKCEDITYKEDPKWTAGYCEEITYKENPKWIADYCKITEEEYSKDNFSPENIDEMIEKPKPVNMEQYYTNFKKDLQEKFAELLKNYIATIEDSSKLELLKIGSVEEFVEHVKKECSNKYEGVKKGAKFEIDVRKYFDANCNEEKKLGEVLYKDIKSGGTFRKDPEGKEVKAADEAARVEKISVAVETAKAVECAPSKIITTFEFCRNCTSLDLEAVVASGNIIDIECKACAPGIALVEKLRTELARREEHANIEAHYILIDNRQGEWFSAKQTVQEREQSENCIKKIFALNKPVQSKSKKAKDGKPEEVEIKVKMPITIFFFNQGGIDEVKAFPAA